MTVSVDWIRDFARIPDSVDDRVLAERVTLSVCEVDDFYRTVSGDVVVGRIVSVADHPDASGLKLAEVDAGGGRRVRVVCGAGNCREGILVPYAGVGTRLADGRVLEAARIRGVESEGMLCAGDELGLSGDHEGVLELGDGGAGSVKAGDDLETVFPGLRDLVLDIDNKSLTHRPDCWGHYGLAREFAAVFNVPFEGRFDSEWAQVLRDRIDSGGSGFTGEQDGVAAAAVEVEVDADSANLGFCALSVDGLVVGESPVWMQRRLLAAGMRPVNSVVDVSNYVMLELGLPNHIFDRESLKGDRIIVRKAGRDMDFVTLDGQERRILASDTMVCDAETEQGIAGIMGGLHGSVTGDTTRIVIEVANWKDSEIRKTSSRLGLRTDASQRYEKSLDSLQLETCVLRIYELLTDLHKGAHAVGGVLVRNMPAVNPVVVETSSGRLGRVLGRDVEPSRVISVLESLGFGVEYDESADLSKDTRLLVAVPSWRATKDVECEADIVEEVGRILGYGSIPPVSPKQDITALRLSGAKIMQRSIQDFLVLRGRCQEVMTYPLVGKSLLKQASWKDLNEELVLVNALNSDHDRMRPSLVPGLLGAVSLNRKSHDSVRIFEYGRSYTADSANFARDLYHLGIVFSGAENLFVPLADTVEELLPCIGLNAELVPGDPMARHSLIPRGWEGSHPHEFLDVRVDGVSRGVVVSLHPLLARSTGLKGHTALAVLDLTDFVETPPARAEFVYKPLDRFPASRFDVTVLADRHVHASDAVQVVRDIDMKEISSVGVLDVFDLEKGKAVTLRVSFRGQDRTLDSEFLSGAEKLVMDTLDSAGFPLRR